jgi:hypothetical protein
MLKSTSILSCVLVSALLLASSSAFGAPKGKAFSDAAVKKAILRAAEYLWKQQGEDGSWPGHGNGRYPTGPGAMAIYALLESGVNPQDPRMKKALAWLERTPEKMVYCLGMRANAWEVANRTTDDKYIEILKSDIRRVIESTADGSFHYETGGSPKHGGDNSTSQFGLLAMWAGSLNDVGIRTGVWTKCMNHWIRTQSPEGGWDYKGIGNKPTMTAAGIASMYVCVDNLYAQTFVKKRARAKDFKALMVIQKAVNRIDSTFKNAQGGGHGYYYMYGVERVGLACGYKYLNGKDWYKNGATHLLGAQKGDGSWGEVYSTSFAMLFLIRGQHPVLFNKLIHKGDWNNRPRDLASLTRWMSKTFEKTLNWQIVDLKMPIHDWHDAPILVITGSEDPKFTDADIAKFKKFVQQGGTILSVTESTFGGSAFKDAMGKAYEQMFPDYKLTALPKSHALYTPKVYYKVSPASLKFQVVSNGVRPLVIHTDQDMVARWQAGVATTTEGATHFRGATNIARYVAGQLYNLRHRGVSHWPRDRGGQTKKTIRIARVKYTGNWNPEPMADKALAIKMKNRAGVKLEVGEPVSLTDLPSSGVKLALMTGTDAVAFSSSETAALKSFVEGGGSLLIDVAGGSGSLSGVKPFSRSIRDMVKKEFPGRRRRSSLRQMAFGAPLYGMEGYTIKTVNFRQHTRLKITEKTPQLYSAVVGGRSAIMFSEMDLTAGLVGYPSLVVDGYTPDSAFDIVRNVILFTNK